ncbi:MAG: cytochrome C oxidase subunit IV family protein [Gammaproteobacteria bacterium]
MTWLLLVTLTVLSMSTAQLGDSSQWQNLPLWGAILILASAGFKVRQILMVYLNLRVSSAGWKSGFMILLIATLVLVFLGYLVPHLG